MLFKKLNEEIQKNEVKQEVINISETDKKAYEDAIIFGDILESLDADVVEDQYLELTEETKTALQVRSEQIKSLNRQDINKNIAHKDTQKPSSYDVDASTPEPKAKEVPNKIKNDQVN